MAKQNDPNKLKLGQIIRGNQERDAIHIAVVPVIVGGVTLHAGCKFKIVGNEAVRALVDEAVGVIDPYLKVALKKGDTVWGFLNPGSIKSLRHHWEHPAFPDDR